MGFNSMLNYKYSTTHENRFWNKLVEKLSGEYDQVNEQSFLLGNLIIEGKEIDAIFIKEDAIIVIDFKDYGGKLSISENEKWLTQDTQINSGRKNPFAQLSDNKYAVLNILKRTLPPGYENWINIGHINALVLFHQDIEYNLDNLKSDLSQSASMWFSLCDFRNICQSIDEITSKSTIIKGENTQTLFKSIGINKFKEYQKNKKTESKSVNSEKESVDFSELYHSQARSMESIDFIIIGQDPYPTNPNGVAFCKNSHYEFFQENCSGGLVLKSLGFSKADIRREFKNPKVLFYDLLITKGICFLNINNSLFRNLSIEEVITSTKETRDFNIDLVNKSNYTILLGKGKTKHYFTELYGDNKPDHVLIHPSFNAKNNYEKEWSETWESNTLERIIKESC